MGFFYWILFFQLLICSHKLIPMNRLILSFPSVFDLHDFKRQTNVTHSEAIVNRLTGHFTQEELQIATTIFKAELVKDLTVRKSFLNEL